MFERCRVVARLDLVDGILGLGACESRRARSPDEPTEYKD
jgi:hypothetical protein